MRTSSPTEERRIARRAKTYVAVDGELYKCSPSAVGMLMKCIPTHQGKELLLEIHAGICGHHDCPLEPEDNSQSIH
jgi:hypothetical protein